MKGFLRALLNWLDRKFPDKVVMTVADLNNFKLKIAEIEKIQEILKLQSEKIAKFEAEINKLNISLGFGMSSEKLKVMPFSR